MKIIYACHCGSPRLSRDATERVNKPGEFTCSSTVTCDDCGYDGREYHAVEVKGGFDIDSSNVAPAVLARSVKVTL